MSDRRFVILRHDHPFLHWDFLIEEDEHAQTWRLMREPCLNEPILAEPLAKHRLMYLDYEGPVSGNRGSVVRVLSGTISDLTQEADGISGSVIRLVGQSFADRANLFQSRNQRWFIQFERD
jgi:hypothetical protein